MATEYLLSGHAQKRLKERLKVKNVRRAYREMELAYNKGTLINYMPTSGNAYILFNNAVYIFKEMVSSFCKMVLLVTVFKDIDKVYQSYIK